MTEELKPVRCGCGGEAKIWHNYGGLCFISCNKCDITTKGYDNHFLAIEGWNEAMSERTAKVTMELRCVDGIAYQQHICSSCGNSLDIPQVGKSPDWKPNYCKSCGARLEWDE